MSKPDFQKWDKWATNLETIKDELFYLDRSRKIFLKVWDTINQNNELKKHINGDYINWLIHNYCVRLGMSIRRLVEADRKKKAPSIYNLLDDIEKNIQQITADNLAKYFIREKEKSSKCDKKTWHGVALNNYEKALGTDRKELLLGDLGKDIDFVRIGTKIKDYVDKNWAHKDKDRAKVRIPVIEEAHKCLDELIEIYNRYSLLINGKPIKSDEGYFLNGWDVPLKILWVSPD